LSWIESSPRRGAAADIADATKINLNPYVG
jgi:hypothetical protein